VSFFFQAEDGIRDGHVTGVQTCALPICRISPRSLYFWMCGARYDGAATLTGIGVMALSVAARRSPAARRPPRCAGAASDRVWGRSEERRVGKECRARWWGCAEKREECRV